MNDAVLTRCAYCKGVVEDAHERYVDFSPTGRMVVFHRDCEAKRGTAPPEAVGDRAANVVRIGTSTRALGRTTRRIPDPLDDYDD